MRGGELSPRPGKLRVYGQGQKPGDGTGGDPGRQGLGAVRLLGRAFRGPKLAHDDPPRRLGVELAGVIPERCRRDAWAARDVRAAAIWSGGCGDGLGALGVPLPGCAGLGSSSGRPLASVLQISRRMPVVLPGSGRKPERLSDRCALSMAASLNAAGAAPLARDRDRARDQSVPRVRASGTVALPAP